ncbi:MAG: FAD-binding oxidoreductase, partial [Bacteroidota bacterium]
MKFHALKVLDVIHETPDAFTIKLEKPADEAFNYTAGQYLTIRADVHGQDERRAYSLSSSPVADDHLSVTIKAISDGKVSNYLKNTLEPGDQLEVFPPMGKFLLKPDPGAARHHIMIAGGSGITPVMSMIKTALLQEPKSKITLIYSNSTENDIIFKDQLDELQQKNAD